MIKITCILKKVNFARFYFIYKARNITESPYTSEHCFCWLQLNEAKNRRSAADFGFKHEKIFCYLQAVGKQNYCRNVQLWAIFSRFVCLNVFVLIIFATTCVAIPSNEENCS
jgi:hypothetical protein